MRYSLANHVLSIKSNDATLNGVFGVITIGGEGSYLDSIELNAGGSLWSVNPYATGGYTFNKNLDRSGTATLSLNQLSDAVATLKRMAGFFYTGDYDGFTLTLTTNEGNLIATCIDCFISGIPAQKFGNTAENQSWSFVCGKIIYNS